jgi:hypothetical protein
VLWFVCWVGPQIKSRKRETAKQVGEKTEEQHAKEKQVLRLKEEVNNVAERRRDFDAGEIACAEN